MVGETQYLVSVSQYNISTQILQYYTVSIFFLTPSEQALKG